MLGLGSRGATLQVAHGRDGGARRRETRPGRASRRERRSDSCSSCCRSYDCHSYDCRSYDYHSYDCHSYYCYSCDCHSYDCLGDCHSYDCLGDCRSHGRSYCVRAATPHLGCVHSPGFAFCRCAQPASPPAACLQTALRPPFPPPLQTANLLVGFFFAVPSGAGVALSTTQVGFVAW